ncbi:MAG: hypothetical protein PHI68_06755, partial [Candidatus Cloacimonetes bacterium]|nr:hypothetical protein [Candidatus Cloacimonadota bacterium]
MSDYQKTVVTACDHNYLWGAMLLGLSLRYYQIPCYYHVVGFNLPAMDVRILESIPDTKVIRITSDDPRSVCTQKPVAILSAQTQLIIWMDSDCVVTGDVDRYLIAPEGKFQIRFRDKSENSGVFRNFYKPGDAFGSIPKQVLDIWQRDLSDLSAPRIETNCQTNCFVLTREHIPFIEFWKEQMEKVIPLDTLGVYARNSIAYAMTDESVINSLFAFSSKAPETSTYMLDKDPQAYCAHFGLKPKPWQHWTLQALVHYDFIFDLLNWAKINKISLPP